MMIKGLILLINFTHLNTSIKFPLLNFLPIYAIQMIHK